MWTELGVWVKSLSEWSPMARLNEERMKLATLSLSAACFAIAQRLQHLRGLPPNYLIDENNEQLAWLLNWHGLILDPSFHWKRPEEFDGLTTYAVTEDIYKVGVKIALLVGQGSRLLSDKPYEARAR